MTTKQVSKGKEEKPPLSKGKEAKSERPKSSHLADLEASFDRDARRIRPFALLGLDTQGEQPGPEPTTIPNTIPDPHTSSHSNARTRYSFLGKKRYLLHRPSFRK